MIEQISNYYKTLNLQKYGINENSSLEEVIVACMEKAFTDSIMQGAGNSSHIRSYVNEVERAKSRLLYELQGYFTCKPLEEFADFRWWHAVVVGKLKECFVEYNKDRENARFGRKVGFTLGNAQKFINMTMKDLYSYFVYFNKAEYKPYFVNCHIPFDNFIYNYINSTVIPYYENKQDANTVSWLKNYVKIPWSVSEDDLGYYQVQFILKNYLLEQKEYKNYSALECEFDIWAKEKLK